MPNSAASLGSFVDPFNYSTPGTSVDHDMYNSFTHNDGDADFVANPNSLGAKISDWLGITNYESEYNQWLSKQDRDYERASINSARAWEEYLDSTKVQRTVADMKKAGLNPWLAVQNGVSASAQGSSVNTGGSHSARSLKNNSGNNALLGLATIAKILALLA